jgi:hypothetical protein
MVIVCACAARSEVSIGLTLRSTLDSYSQKTADPNSIESSGSDFGLDIGPIVRFKVSSKAEVAPFIGLSIDNSSSKVGAGSTTSTDNTGMFFGCGMYFFMAENSLFKFSLGPRLHGGFWFTKTDFDFGVNMPLNFDIMVAGPWSIRASASVIDLWYSYSDNGGTRRGSFNYNMMSFFMPELSFFVTF